MKMLLMLLANLVCTVADFGAGFRSGGILFSPEIPEELQDLEKE